MAQYFTTHIKPQVKAHLDAAGITGDAAKTIMAFERASQTCMNHMEKGMSWMRMCEAGFIDRAAGLLRDLSGNTGRNEPTAKYWDEWCKYCEQAGYVPNINMGDVLA